MSFVFLSGVLVLLHIQGTSSREYHGYAVIKATPKTEQQMYYLQSLEELVQSPPFDVDVWKLSSSLTDSSLVMLNPKASRSILQEFDELDLEYTYAIPDVER